MYLARSIIALIVSSVSAFQAAELESVELDSAGAGDRFEIAVVETMVYHRSRRSLLERCSVGRNVYGCTEFPLESLECKCEPRQADWSITARATISAVIHLSSEHPINQVLMHERMHVADLEFGLRAHLEELASRHFKSRRACETLSKVLTESPHLVVVMNRLRTESNAKFGCDRMSRF